MVHKPLKITVVVQRALLIALALLASLTHAHPASVDFGKDIRPILSDRCFSCHGPDSDKRKAGLRLDQREDAFKKLESGHFAIVPNHPEQSRLLEVIRLPASHEDRMPPAKAGKELTTAQIELIQEWIAQGAPWSEHWAYLAPQRPPPPSLDTTLLSSPRNEIDRFIFAALQAQNLAPNPEADRTTLIRRAALDLTGLPPSLEEVDTFVNDSTPLAYERMIQRLLASPHFGERMALAWLDQARYADTSGYHFDGFRQMHLWRDWVIKAYNDNKPFDQFTIEQLAGDLLPNATLEQKIATGFHRNVMTTDEGGVDPEEYMAKYCSDRVNTTAQVWLGTTMGCAECHDHKYDPISIREFYQMYAFFHNVSERGLDGTRTRNPAPVIQVPSPDQASRLLGFLSSIPRAEKRVADLEQNLPKAQTEWESNLRKSTNAPTRPNIAGLTQRFPPPAPTPASSSSSGSSSNANANANANVNLNLARGFIANAYLFLGKTNNAVTSTHNPAHDPTNNFSFGAWIRPTSLSGTVVSKMAPPPTFQGWDLLLSNGHIESHLVHRFPENAIKVSSRETLSSNQWHHVFISYNGSGKAAGFTLYLNATKLSLDIPNDSLQAPITTNNINTAPLLIGSRIDSLPFSGKIDGLEFYDRALNASEVQQLFKSDLTRVARIPAAERSAEQNDALRKLFRETEATDLTNAKAALAKLQKDKEQLLSQIPDTMVMDEREQPRDTFILVRGNFQNHGEKVHAATPSCWPSLPTDQPTNRLALARWIVSPQNPLAARVAINRIWALFFGTGLVKTSNDFGSQGERPSHPELLDWLASEFMKPETRFHPSLGIPAPQAWDIKHMIRLMVTSASYRQSAQISAIKLEKDPYNRLISRAPRNRLDAELIRDNALAISGLLDRRIGGPSVKPYQPPGIWNVTDHQYDQSKGADLYRRGMYVLWKRAAHYPSFQTFDAPSRETCTMLRPRTSTPLQSLVLMNDPVYVEAARALAARAMIETGPDSTPPEQIRHAFRLSLARPPHEDELATLIRTYRFHHQRFTADPKTAEQWLSIGESQRPAQLNTLELAALASVANVLLNLNETITR